MSTLTTLSWIEGKNCLLPMHCRFLENPLTAKLKFIKCVVSQCLHLKLFYCRNLLIMFKKFVVQKQMGQHIFSLFNAVKRSYDFDDDYNINKGLLTKSIGKMVTSITNLDVKNGLGMFRGKKNNEYFPFFQDAWKDPPSFPKPKKFGTKSKKLTRKI